MGTACSDKGMSYSEWVSQRSGILNFSTCLRSPLYSDILHETPIKLKNIKYSP